MQVKHIEDMSREDIEAFVVYFTCEKAVNPPNTGRLVVDERFAKKCRDESNSEDQK